MIFILNPYHIISIPKFLWILNIISGELIMDDRNNYRLYAEYKMVRERNTWFTSLEEPESMLVTGRTKWKWNALQSLYNFLPVLVPWFHDETRPAVAINLCISFRFFLFICFLLPSKSIRVDFSMHKMIRNRIFRVKNRYPRLV